MAIWSHNYLVEHFGEQGQLGMGFAIPTPRVKFVYDSLRKYGFFAGPRSRRCPGYFSRSREGLGTGATDRSEHHGRFAGAALPTRLDCGRAMSFAGV